MTRQQKLNDHMALTNGPPNLLHHNKQQSRSENLARLMKGHEL